MPQIQYATYTHEPRPVYHSSAFSAHLELLEMLKVDDVEPRLSHHNASRMISTLTPLIYTVRVRY